MKPFITTLIATSILAGLAAPESAYARRDKPRKKHVIKQRYVPRNAEADNWGQTTQVQYDINKLPFGSKLWWEQYLRTSGGGQGGGGDGGGR
jgi:hypothetical protein